MVTSVVKAAVAAAAAPLLFGLSVGVSIRLVIVTAFFAAVGTALVPIAAGRFEVTRERTEVDLLADSYADGHLTLEQFEARVTEALDREVNGPPPSQFPRPTLREH